MTDPTADRPASLLEWERLQKGLLSEEEAARVRARLAAFGDPTEDLPSDAVAFADDPEERFVANVRAAIAEERAAPRRRAVRILVPILAAAVAVLAVGPRLLPGEDGRPDVLLKGEAEVVLEVYRDGSDGPEALEDGDGAALGDVLQLAFRAPGMTHGLLYSVDGRGVVTVHHRFAGQAPPSGRVLVPTAYRLDDAPEFEAIHLVAAPRPFDTEALLERAERARPRRAGPVPPPGGVVRTVVLHKEAP